MTTSLLVIMLCAAEAASRKVQVPNKYDGAWSITATTQEGACAPSTSYQVKIENSDASIPGDVNIDGGVSADGTVQATIIQGANRVPISGHLDPKGSGSGAWHTDSGLFTCRGSWSARKSG
jgi:hypothetical protein